MNPRTLLLVTLAGAAIALAARATETAGHDKAHQPAAAAPASGPRTVTSEALHRSGGVPRGWKFALPAGDPARGRQVFVDLECFKCHTITGGNFPAVEPDPKNAGPDLTSMGPHHPAEYFAESVLAPNAVIVSGPGHTGPDGLSIMPSFADAISVTQLVDLVAFLKSQAGGDAHAGHGQDVEREAVAGDYRIRLVFARHGAGTPSAGHTHHGTGPAPAGPVAGAPGGHAHGPGDGQGGSTGRGHLMVFVADREHGEAVPYLRVTATVQAPGAQPRTVVLAPMTSDRGFHYGADVVLPARTQKITLSIGPTSMAVMGGQAGRYKTAVRAPFAWQVAAQ